MDDQIFALDIGTRSVVGLIMKKIDDQYEIIDMCSQEHKERSMLDGQIHDVLSVSEVISHVKKTLEEKHGPLKKVCVAAAGRALKTKQVKVSKSIENQPIMGKEDILFLELEAVQKAQYELAKDSHDKKSTHYYCVGYSVLHYQLDGEDIGSLIDQQGTEATLEIIATFLPKVVVESLLSALQRADLEMEALTLEPIAAINVLIPTSMRRLNVALVDIGAGTSDIALTDQGTVSAYGMVPMAGDEITEAVSDQFLLDFPLAEQAKRDLSSMNNVFIHDILGFENEVSYKEMVSQIEYAIDKLVDSIYHEILHLNKRAPKAIMLVGGGSLTPELPRKLAEKFDLPINRVAIRSIDAISTLKKTDNLPMGPSFVTPIGIAIAANQNPVHYISVKVNDRTIRMFDMKQLTVGDCLLATGIEMKKLFGKPGMAKIITINGKSITLPGGYGTAPCILKNGLETSLEDMIQHGDEIVVTPGEDGLSPSITLQELIGEGANFPIAINQKLYTMEPKVKVNDAAAKMTYVIQDRDVISWKAKITVEDALHVSQLFFSKEQLEPFTVIWKGKPIKLPYRPYSIYKNGIECSLSSTIQSNDRLEWIKNAPFTLKDLLAYLSENVTKEIKVMFNGKWIVLSQDMKEVYRNGEKLSFASTIQRHDELIVKEKQENPFIFQDIFRFVELDINTNTKKTYVVRKNDKPATFYDHIVPGDHLEIRWETPKNQQSI
ncbi:pilus assembly protein PilM [Bacillaceae bacterium S4-13-56]